MPKFKVGDRVVGNHHLYKYWAGVKGQIPKGVVGTVTCVRELQKKPTKDTLEIRITWKSEKGEVELNSYSSLHLEYDWTKKLEELL